MVQRILAGVAVGSRTGRRKASLVHVEGSGWQVRVRRIQAVTVAPPETPTSAQLSASALADELAEVLAVLAEKCHVPLINIEVLGLDDPATAGNVSALPAFVAERTGLTVVSDFRHRDHAAGGSGTPLDVLPDWFLFRTNKVHRLLLHMGSMLRATVLPAKGGPQDVFCADAGPCGVLLDGLVQRLSRGVHPMDRTGHFAVQGRVDEGLIEQWMYHPFFVQPVPRFLDAHEAQMEFRESFFEKSLAWARDRKLTARDVLCSANHLIVRSLIDLFRRAGLSQQPVEEVWVTGGCAGNGLLWKLFGDELAPAKLRRTDDLHIPSEARRATHAALLGFCVLENLPANVPSLSGARGPRLLGQVTPGSPEHWDRWITHVAERLDGYSQAA